MNRTKTVSEIKRKYSELIACLAPERSSYRNDVNKLIHDCKEELHAKYDALIIDFKESVEDAAFVAKLEDEMPYPYPSFMGKYELFDSENDYELLSILRPNE